MIRFAVCDDEPAMVQDIADRLSRYMAGKQPYQISRFTSGQALLETGCPFDMIFLDIQMEQPDGMETARLLRQRNDRSLIIFVTVLQECVFDAFAVEAYDYLLKPLDSARFQRTMDRAIGFLRQQAHVVIQRGNACTVVPLAQIIYCEVQGRKVYIHQSDGTVVDYYDRLDALAQRLDGRFFRCHRSYLVNLACIRSIREGQVMLPQNAVIPVSRLRERELTQALLRYMKERSCGHGACQSVL